VEGIYSKVEKIEAYPTVTLSRRKYCLGPGGTTPSEAISLNRTSSFLTFFVLFPSFEKKKENHITSNRGILLTSLARGNGKRA
jgi:hypothetical protein